MLQFQYMYFLALLGLIPLIWGIYLYARKRKKKVLKQIGDEAVVNQLLSQYKKSSFVQKFILTVAGMGLLVLALANLRSPSGANAVNRNGIDVMIAFDVSKSMLAQDIKPTRLDRAKQILNRLIDRLGNDRVGIVVFAGKAYLQMPLSADHAAAKMYLSAATPESIPTQGTVIADALKMCYATFDSKEKKYKAVVLISDGEDHDEKALATATQMAGEGVIIHTIGIGSTAGSPIMDETTGELKKDNDGNTVISKLNEAELRAIADKGNGTYQLFSNTDNVVSNIIAQLNSMDQRAVKDDSLVNYQSFFQFFLGAAFLFLLIELFISETRKKKKMNLKPAIGAVVVCLFFSVNAFAQTEKEIIKEGNDAFKKNDYPAAADAYGRAVKKNSANSTAQYNLGNALYKSEKKEASIAAYDSAITQLKTPKEKANAYYNKGVVLQNDKKLPECIEAYKNALKLSPNDDDARQNLQKALQQQKQQQQQQQQQNKKEDQDKKEEKKQEPKPQPSKITQKDAEEKLKALMQKEKNLQDKLHKTNAASVNKPEKDW